MDYDDGLLVHDCGGGDEIVAIVLGIEVVPVPRVFFNGYISFA